MGPFLEPLQELQRTVNGRRLGGLAVIAECGDQIIGLLRPVGRQQQFQNPAARGRQSLLAFRAAGLRRCDGLKQLRAHEPQVVCSIAMMAGGRHGPS